jgi:hypothetical protein
MLGIFNNVSAHGLHIDTEVQKHEIIEVILEVHDEDDSDHEVHDCDVVVYRANDVILISGETDEHGMFTFYVNESVGDEKLVIELTDSGHKESFELHISGNKSTFKLELPKEDDHLHEYENAIAGLGYLMGIAGLVSLFLAWRLKRVKKLNDLNSENQINHE